jgi:hypothetical protein
MAHQLASEFSVANAVFSLATIFASGFVGFLSARRLSTLNTLHQACATFRAALAPVCVELRRAKGRPTSGLDSALSNTLQNVVVAFEASATFVHDGQRVAYEAAWREYEDAAELGSEFMHINDRFSKVKCRVENLLNHAKLPNYSFRVAAKRLHFLPSSEVRRVRYSRHEC